MAGSAVADYGSHLGRELANIAKIEREAWRAWRRSIEDFEERRDRLRRLGRSSSGESSSNSRKINDAAPEPTVHLVAWSYAARIVSAIHLSVAISLFHDSCSAKTAASTILPFISLARGLTEIRWAALGMQFRLTAGGEDLAQEHEHHSSQALGHFDSRIKSATCRRGQLPA